MSTSNPQSTTKSPPKDNQPIPSKYTYADVSNFNRTILAILSHKNLCTLRVLELKTILHFTFVIADLLDCPQIFNYSIKEKLQISNLPPSEYPRPRIKGLRVISNSKKCLRELVNWMGETVTITKLNLEKLLDVYYKNFPYPLKPQIIRSAQMVKLSQLNDNNRNSGKP
jgi:hypothetical protein